MLQKYDAFNACRYLLQILFSLPLMACFLLPNSSSFIISNLLAKLLSFRSESKRDLVEMGSSDEASIKGIDALMAGLVWVRHINGSWCFGFLDLKLTQILAKLHLAVPVTYPDIVCNDDRLTSYSIFFSQLLWILFQMLLTIMFSFIRQRIYIAQLKAEKKKKKKSCSHSITQAKLSLFLYLHLYMIIYDNTCSLLSLH